MEKQTTLSLAIKDLEIEAAEKAVLNQYDWGSCGPLGEIEGICPRAGTTKNAQNHLRLRIKRSKTNANDRNQITQSGELFYLLD